MALFLSTTINKLDKKGRLSIPSPFRSALAAESYQGVVLFQSYVHECIEAVGMSFLQDIHARMDHHFDLFSQGHDDMATTLFGDSVPCAFDGEGRITVPRDLIEGALIEDQVAIIGLGQKFQLWNPDKLAKRKQQARQSMQNNKITLPKGQVS